MRRATGRLFWEQRIMPPAQSISQVRCKTLLATAKKHDPGRRFAGFHLHIHGKMDHGRREEREETYVDVQLLRHRFFLVRTIEWPHSDRTAPFQDPRNNKCLETAKRKPLPVNVVEQRTRTPAAMNLKWRFAGFPHAEHQETRKGKRWTASEETWGSGTN